MVAQLTKKDVARRQLATAIRLFFSKGDPVSIYSLASNAWEIIDVLCNRAGIESMSNHTRQHVPDGRDLKFHYINSPHRNFFKHADRDPDAVLADFKVKDVDAIIFLAVEDYIRLYKKSPVEFQTFQLWYMATNLEKISAESLRGVLDAIDVELPRINQLPREEQIIMGRDMFEKAYKDKELTEHPQTEHPF